MSSKLSRKGFVKTAVFLIIIFICYIKNFEMPSNIKNTKFGVQRAEFYLFYLGRSRYQSLWSSMFLFLERGA